VLWSLRVAGEEAVVVHRVAHAARRMTLAAVRHRLYEVLAARSAARRRRRRRRVPRREGSEPRGKEYALEEGHRDALGLIGLVDGRHGPQIRDERLQVTLRHAVEDDIRMHG